MPEAEHQSTNQRRKSGSENRQKQLVKTFRVSPEEDRELSAHAERVGLTVSSYVRSQTLQRPKTASRRRPPVELVELTRLQGQVNRVGGNIHQLLKRVNFGDTPLGEEIRDAFAGYKEAIAAIMEVCGRGKR